MPRRYQFDTALIEDDMVERGWQPADLAGHALVSRSSVTRFLRGEFQTPRMAAKLATALGFPVRKYVVRKSDDEQGAAA